MTRRIRACILGASLALAACTGKPLPADKADYAGRWRGPGVTLEITADGHARYDRAEGNGRVKIDGPIQGFDGDDFVVGVMVVTTSFDVTAPPTETNGVWTMTVDGVVLTRAP
jgi:hypothetical protein